MRALLSEMRNYFNRSDTTLFCIWSWLLAKLHPAIAVMCDRASEIRNLTQTRDQSWKIKLPGTELSFNSTEYKKFEAQLNYKTRQTEESIVSRAVKKNIHTKEINDRLVSIILLQTFESPQL